MFPNAIYELGRTYRKNSKDKGDSWEKMSIEEMHDKFYEELEELEMARSKKEYFFELVDVVLVGLMLIEVIDKNRKVNERGTNK